MPARRPSPTPPPPDVPPPPPQPPRWAMEKAALAWEARRQHRPSDLYRDHVSGRLPQSCYQWQFHRSNHIVRAMALGNGSGKTTAAAVEADWWLQHRHHYQRIPDWAVQVVWVCQKYAQMDMLREQLESTALTRGWAWNESKHKYTWGPGDTMYVVSNDGDWATIQGVNPDLVIIDEECDEKLWRELQMRRRGRKKTRFVIAATATKGKRWMYKDLFAPWVACHRQLGLAEDQAMLAQKHPRIWMWPRGGVEDNPIATQDDVDWYENGVTYQSSAEKTVRRRGGFQDFNAAPVFDAGGMDAIELWQHTDGPASAGGVDGELDRIDPAKWSTPGIPEYRFVPTRGQWRGGRITIYEMPGDDHYAVGADFAQGLAEGDFDAACVVRRGDDGNAYQVAEAEGRWGTGPFSFVLLALGWFYNQALIVGESNAMGMACLRRLYDELDYHYLYTRAVKPEARYREKGDLLGYHKGANSLITRRLMWAIAPSDRATGRRLPPRFYPRSARATEQLRRYQYMPRTVGRDLSDTPEQQLVMGAPPGYNDDLVSAAAGAVEGWLELPRFVKPEPDVMPGSAADVLGHKAIIQKMKGTKKKGAFTFAKR